MKVFSLANEEEIFIKKEDPEGTLVYPGATDYLLAMGVSTFGQDDELLDDGQLRGGRSRLSPIKGRTHPGNWNYTTYVKPSGALGTAPEADVLFEGLFGKKTVNEGASVVYSLDASVNLPSHSLWVKKGHSIFAMEGCTTNVGEFAVSGSEIGQIAWSGQFMKWYKAGTAKLTQDVLTGATTCVVDVAERFSTEKIKIQIGDDDNGGDGYLITHVNYDTKVITFTPQLAGAGESSGAKVKGWWPTTGTEVGAPVFGALGICTLDEKNFKILSSVLTFTNNIKYYEDEKNGELYATTYEAIGWRDVAGVLTLYFYKGAKGYFYRSASQIQDALIIPCGDTPGKIMEISCPTIEYKTPSLSGDEEIIMELPYQAVGTVAQDNEITLTFK